MMEWDSNEVDRLIGLYLDGVATSDEAARLSRLIAGNAQAARAMADACRLDSAMTEYFGERDAEASERLRSSMKLDAGVRAPAARNLRRVFNWLSLAAAAVLVFGVGSLLLWPARPDAALGVRVAEVSGECWVATIQNPEIDARNPESSNGVPAVVGMEIRQGDRVVVKAGGKVGLKYDGEATVLELHSAVASFSADQGAKRVKLGSGLLLCTAAPQAKPFQMATSHGVATVVGTQFVLDADKRETTLAVREGTVLLSRDSKHLEVKAGETALATANELRMVAPEDAWLKELVMRAETGPWDAVDFGQGAFAQRGWCMDARGSPAARLLWNVRASPQVELLRFDSARWRRAVVACQVMFLGSETAAPVSPVAGEIPNPQMSLSGSVGGAGPGADVLALSAFVYAGLQPGLFGETISLTRGKPISYDVWHWMILYFDLAAGGPHVISAFWPEAGGLPAASQWQGAFLPKLARSGQAGFGLVVAPNYRVMVKGLKLVPLGPEMAPPPAGLRSNP